MPQKIPIAVVGAAGYTGVELVRILLAHPQVRIGALTSRRYAGERFADVFPAFAQYPGLKCEKPDVSKISKKIKAVFLCLPHGESMETAASFRAKGVKVVDLSADFRIKNPLVYEKWYGAHTQKKLLGSAVYGLPELYRDKIRLSSLVSVPGCYPTSIILATAPLLEEKMILPDQIICDSKSGVSGAGRNTKTDLLFSEVSGNFKPYNIGIHRHTPEIEQELSLIAGEDVKILFAPHLLPVDRGILSTVYCKPVRKLSTKELSALFVKRYGNEEFVKILPEGFFPSTKNVRGTNNCQIGVFFDARTERIVVVSAIDNLTKGASGQAVQSFNLMYGFPESTGLNNIGFFP